MKIIFSKSWWEMMRDPAEVFLDRVAADGFDASEFYLEHTKANPATVRQWHVDRGLQMIGQFITEGETPDQHIDTLERRFAACVEAGAILVNGHIGRGYVATADSLKFSGSCEQRLMRSWCALKRTVVDLPLPVIDSRIIGYRAGDAADFRYIALGLCTNACCKTSRTILRLRSMRRDTSMHASATPRDHGCHIPSHPNGRPKRINTSRGGKISLLGGERRRRLYHDNPRVRSTDLHADTARLLTCLSRILGQ